METQYNVRLVRMTLFYIQVEAEDEDEAYEKALELAEENKIADFEEEDEHWEILDCEELD